MVSPDFITETSWLRDGVHLQFSLRSYCMQLLRPLVERTALATFSNTFENFKDMPVELQCLRRELNQLDNLSFFRTWVQTTQEKALTLKNQFGDFSLVSHLEELGDECTYHELLLRRLP
jgi:hypothetical protein